MQLKTIFFSCNLRTN